MKRPRVLIEEWLPAQAIGVECMRERGSSSALGPHTFIHVWWARRPLTASRAAVLASLLPADFDRECFERLLGFGMAGQALVRLRNVMDSGVRLGGFRCKRAFANVLREPDLEKARQAMEEIWGGTPAIADPMAGGGSIPLEAARLGLHVLANEYNPVACSVLEATVDYPFRLGPAAARKARNWALEWRARWVARVARFFPQEKGALPDGYIFARTVPCPDTGHPTPLVPDWHLLRPKSGRRVVAEPVVLDKKKGKWTVRIRDIGRGPGQLREPPQPTYGAGDGVSLFTGTFISGDYIKAMAQQGKMGSALYAIAVKGCKLDFRPPNETDLKALAEAEKELARLRPQWEAEGVIPIEEFPEVCSDERPRLYGMPRWADMFSPRQLLALGVLVEELHRLRPEIVRAEGQEMGEAVVHLLALALDKFANYNCYFARWHSSRAVIAGKMDRHDYAFKPAYAELASCVAGAGLEWALDNVIEAYEKLAELPKAPQAKPATITFGSATNLADIEDKSVTAVVVDPPYADNVQYSELADFFYVWLKRTQGHRHPDWFASYLCERDQEAVVNIARHRKNGQMSAKEARQKAHEFYQRLMTEAFKEAHRILRDDGVLTVMFTHKKQEAWASLFQSLIDAGFTTTATWPIKTESEHSLHQARKNAAQSTVLLVARKREAAAGLRYFDEEMRAEIREAARRTAARLRDDEGLNPVDQLVGAFGAAMEVFSRCGQVRTDTGDPVDVGEAIQAAADAVADWRVEQLAERGLQDVDPESRFFLLCWDVLGAAEFRFNEAMLLGRAVGMDVDQMKMSGLVASSGEKVRILSAKERRRAKPVLKPEDQPMLFGLPDGGKKKVSRKVHPNDEFFASAIDMCHALALRHAEAGGGQAGIGAARGTALQQGWKKDSACARLMEALVRAAPQAVRFPGNGRQKTAADDYPEFRAWHAMLKPLFGIEPPEWKPMAVQLTLEQLEEAEEEDDETGGE